MDEALKDESFEIKKKEFDGPKSNCFWIKLDKGFKRASRWEIAFHGENRKHLIRKILEGCKLRNQMDSLLRYNYYVENMPQDDIENLQNHIQLNIISKVSIPFDQGDIEPLLGEVNTNFLKLQNRILFDKYLLSADSHKLFSRPLELK